MIKSRKPELMDDPSVPEDVLSRFHLELARLNRILGNSECLLRRIRRNPPRTVLDIGCGCGALLAEVRDALGVAVQGVDLRPLARIRTVL